MVGDNEDFRETIKKDIQRAFSPARKRLDQTRADLLDHMYFTDSERDNAVVRVNRNKVDYIAEFTLAPSQEPSTAIYLNSRGSGGEKQFYLVQESVEEVEAAMKGKPSKQTLEAWNRHLPRINDERIDDMLKALKSFEMGEDMRIAQAEQTAKVQLSELQRTRSALAPTPVQNFGQAALDLVSSLINRSSDQDAEGDQDAEDPIEKLDREIRHADERVQGIRLYRDTYLDVLLQECQEKRESLIKDKFSEADTKRMQEEISQLAAAYEVNMLDQDDLTPLTQKWKDAISVKRGATADQTVVPFAPPIPTLDGDS